jgi:hypothetical protein
MGVGSRMADTHWTRDVLRGNLMSTWHVLVRTRWDAISGCLQAELGHGPKRKIEAHIMPYKSCLRVIVIRVLH